MNKYLRKLCEDLASQPLGCRDWDTDSMLSFLYFCYTEDHPLDSAAVRRCLKKLWPILDGLPPEDSNELFRNIAELCAASEQAAFEEGVKAGAALRREIYTVGK